MEALEILIFGRLGTLRISNCDDCLLLDICNCWGTGLTGSKAGAGLELLGARMEDGLEILMPLELPPIPTNWGRGLGT